ncbi:MAG: choice-of-anchor M domain-containing protein [Verrucomicrobiales bacterium]|nr:choice-of-anchor M domain-containing protein [Verrucomicrobiales bacterium]
MKLKLSVIPITVAALGALLGWAAPAGAATLLNRGHVDIGIGYDAGAFDLHVHDEESDTEYSPGDAVLGVNASARRLTSAGLGVALGLSAGTPLWILPAAQDPELLFLGLGTEELSDSEWSGNLSLTLKGISGPGSVAAWSVGSLGEISVHLNSRDGVNASDRFSLLAGSHGHVNLGFTEPGNYELLFEATGTHLTDGVVASGDVAYAFSVIPEPSVGRLAAIGVVTGWLFRRRTRCASRTVG